MGVNGLNIAKYKIAYGNLPAATKAVWPVHITVIYSAYLTLIKARQTGLSYTQSDDYLYLSHPSLQLHVQVLALPGT